MSAVVDSMPDFNDDDEIVEMLTRMYREADPLKTGQVRATALVGAFSKVLDHPAVDKWKLGELRASLDPKSDDVPVLMDDFTRAALRWIKSIWNGDAERADFNSTYVKTPRGWPPRSRAHFVSRVESNASSLGLLNVSDLQGAHDATFGSLNGTGSFGLFEIPNAVDDDEEIKTMQKRLSDEKFNRETLKNQLEECEDENDELKKQVERLKRELGEAKKTIQENQERSEKTEKGREDVARPDGEGADFKSETEGEILRKVKEIREELSKTKMREKEALDMADELKLKIRALEDNEATLNGEKTRIEELTGIRERLEEEIRKLQVDCSFLQDRAGGGNRSFATDGDLVGGGIVGGGIAWSSVLEDVSFDRVAPDEDGTAEAGRFLRPPSAHSTPFFRRNLSSPKAASIGEEFRQMGVGRRGLPFCEKNGSLDRSKTGTVKTCEVGVQTERSEEKKGGRASFVERLRRDGKRFKFPVYQGFGDVSDDVQLMREALAEVPLPDRKCAMKALARGLLGLLILSLLSAVAFTFFGAVDIDGRTLYPSTWTPRLGPLWMPRPYAFLAVRYHPVY